MKKSGIYCIENLINGKKYIGQSNNVFHRWSKHQSELNNKKHFNDYLQKAWNKYGFDNFKFYILEFCDISKLDEREVYYIELYQTLNRDKGYNLTAGGQANKVYSLETRKKLSNALLGHEVTTETRKKVSEHHADVSGENNPMYGKHHDDKAKKKISDVNKGRISFRRDLTPVYCVELNRIFDNATIAANILNIASYNILRCCRHERKTCGGYHWEFVNMENNID